MMFKEFPERTPPKLFGQSCEIPEILKKYRVESRVNPSVPKTMPIYIHPRKAQGHEKDNVPYPPILINQISELSH